MEYFGKAGLIAEAPLREKLVSQLREALNPSESIVVQELPLRMGEARVDIAVLGREFSAYELKSDFDTLGRLTTQIPAYSRVFDHVTLVVGSRHLVKASEIIPAWWGLMLGFVTSTGCAELVKVRAPRDNPSPDSYALTQLLWLNEVRDCLRIHFAAVTDERASRQLVCRTLASCADRDIIKSMVMSTIVSRRGQRFA